MVEAAAAVILRADGSFLIARRPPGRVYAGYWEFPGGKVRDGEELKPALRRELKEELAIEAEIGGEVFRLRHRYPDRYVEVVFFSVPSFRGEARNQVFEAITWAKRAELPTFNFLEADRELVSRIARGEIV